MTLLLALLSLCAALVLCGLCLYSLIVPSFVFWPPPSKGSWQDRLFMGLFRVMFYPLVALTLYRLVWLGLWPGGWRLALAAALFVLGFGLALSATLALGWRNAFGAAEGLVKTGIFRFSRNPIYLATWFGLLGWGILLPDPILAATLFFWALAYLGAVFLEERWLEKQYGADFTAYCRQTRRFL